MISKHRRAAWLGTLSIASIAGLASAPLAHASSDATPPASTIDHEYEVELPDDDLHEEMYDDSDDDGSADDADSADDDVVDGHGGDGHGHQDDGQDADADDEDEDEDDDHASTTSSTTPKSTTTTAHPTTTAAPTTLAPTTTASGGDLPATGGDSSALALLAGIGIVGGSLATAAARRRHSS
ncbi:MAG: hypothetical protein RI958_204 [Actinomycetota bacterium]